MRFTSYDFISNDDDLIHSSVVLLWSVRKALMVDTSNGRLFPRLTIRTSTFDYVDPLFKQTLTDYIVICDVDLLLGELKVGNLHLEIGKEVIFTSTYPADSKNFIEVCNFIVDNLQNQDWIKQEDFQQDYTARREFFRDEFEKSKTPRKDSNISLW